MGSFRGLEIHFFGATGRVYGTLIRVRGRAYVVGAMQRGFFYRFGAPIFTPAPGYWESIFAIRRSVGLINLMIENGMKDEIIPVFFRRGRVHGAIHCGCHGSISIILTVLDSEVFPKGRRKDWEIFSTLETEGDSFYESDRKKREQLADY